MIDNLLFCVAQQLGVYQACPQSWCAVESSFLFSDPMQEVMFYVAILNFPFVHVCLGGPKGSGVSVL